MARPRSASKSKRSKTSNEPSTSQGELICPECGKAFSRSASLGAHRNRAHGVRGASARRGRTGSGSGGTSRRGATARTTGQGSGRTRGRASSSNGSSASINRDALLQTLFPKGIPAREDVIRRANAWLDEAERLSRTK
jgi:hypothetical protein